MKKIDKLRVTLLGFLVCLMSMSLMAQRVTMDFTTNGWGLPSDYTNTEATYTNGTYQLTFHPGTVGDGLKFNSNYLIFGKTNASLSLPAFDFNVERIEIVGKSGASTAVKQNIFVNETAVSTETTGAVETNVYEIADAYQAAGNVYTIKVSSKHNTQITYIKVYEASSPAAVAAPTFNPEGGSYFAAQNLTITTTTSDAAIYYTLDSSDPKTNGILYGDNQVIPINQNTVVKAIAVLGEDTSNVTTATYTLNIPVEVATIEAFKAAEHNDNTIYKINGDVKVLGQYDNKKYTFIQDMGQGTYAALCIFDNNGSNINAYNPGDVISGGVYGTYDLYHNLIEMNPVEGLPSAEGTPGEVIAPDVRTLANVIDYYNWFESKLVTIKGLTFTESSTFGTTAATRGVVAVNGDDTINVYNGWGAITDVEVSEGMTADVTGFISRYNDILEIIPRGSEDIVEVVGPAVAPWTATFEDALENSAWEIENETYSNKWYIGQAQGFDNNKLYISSNNGTTNKYVAENSFVKASRAIVVPETGGVLSFNYRANGNDNDYVQVAIVKEGGNRTNLATLHGANDWTSATYTIAPELAGEATLEFLWTNSNNTAVQFPAAIDNVSLVASSCSQPTALQDTVEGTTATISWTGDAEAYLLQYKLADHSEWYSVNTTENTVVLNNLQGNSNYNVRVQSVCGDDASAWVEGNFVVKCQNLIIDSQRDYIVCGTEDGASTNSNIPFYGLYNYSYSQQIVDANEINATSGTIYSVSFKCSSTPASTSTGGIRIWLANTDKATFSSNTDYINPSELTEVYVGPSSYAYQSGWNEFVLTTPFEYTGGNLVVAYYEGNSSYSSSSFYVNSKEGSKAIYHYNDDGSKVSYTDPASNTGSKGVIAYRNVMKFDMDVVTEICGDVEACPAVTNVQVDTITPNSAELTWNRGNESETNFKVEYYAEGSTDVVSVLVEDTAYTLRDLAQLTNYTVKVQALCGENNTSEPVEIEFATPGICPPVSDIQSSNASNTTTLTWIPGGEERAWLVQFKPAEGDNEWISINVNSLPTTTFGGLMATTDYNVRVRAVCDPADEENQSEWANHEFTSGCAAIDAPYSQTFDSYNMPECWDAYGFRFSSGYAYSYDLDAWIMTPAINIPSDETTYLAFDVKGYGNFSVMASYRGTDASRFSEIYLGTIPSNSNYTQVVVPMADNLKGRQVYFKIVNNADQYQYIDNLSVDYCPFVPANLTATHLTENSAVLTWECAEPANNFQVKVGENIVDVEGAKTYTLTGLDASTPYTFFVRTQCGEDSYGDWSEKTFTTPCGAVAVPYTEDFEDYSSGLPDCWTKIGVGTVAVQTSYVYAGSKSLKFSGSTSNVVALPAFDGENLQIRFYTKPEGTYSSCGQFDVGYVNANNEFTALTTYSYNDFTAYEERIVNMSSMPANAKMAFRHRPTNTSYYWFVDNVIVENIPTCGVPTIAIIGTTAIITPKAPGAPESYDLQIGNQIETVPATQTTVDLDSIFTLELNTNYEVRVRANCGEGDQSEWSQTVSFTTPECFGSRTVAIGNGTDTHNSFPTNAFYNYSLSEQIFDASEIGEAGDINKIKFYATSNPVIRNLDVYMIHTTKDAFANESDYIPVSSTDKVFSGNVYIGANQWTTINLDTRFAYNGSDNIALVFVDKTGGYASSYPSYKVHNVPNGQIKTWYAYTDNSAYNPTSSQSGNFIAQRNNIQFDLCPAPVVTCPRPSNLVVDEVTESTANLTWTEGDVETQWEVEYGVEGFVHGEGTSVIVNENTLNLVGLASATTYNVYVRAICAEGDSSLWLSTTPFTTSCAAYTLPYTENFDSYTSTMPICWDRLYTGTSTTYGVGIYAVSDYARSGNNSLRFYNYYSSYSSSNYGDAYAILPEMAADINILGMELYATGEEDWYGDMYSSEFEVGVVTDVNDPANSFVSVQTIAPTSTNYEKFVVSFAEYTGANGHIAFRMLKPSSSYAYAYAYIDDITVDVIPTCGTPTLAVNGTTATITPSTIAGTPASYDLQIGNEIHNVSATETTFTITDVFTDLVYGNTYQMQVRAICGEGDTSAWSAAVDFTYEVVYIMRKGQTQTITTCLGTLYDNGGPNGNYADNSNDVMVINPASEYSVVRLQGNYSTESNYDKIYIYDGVGTEGTPIYNAISGSGYIDATSTTGALTVKFTSDGSTNKTGFAFNISCKQVVFEKDLAINSIDPIAWACDQSDAKVTINVENAGITDTITSFEARYVVNTQAPVSETVNCNLAPGETMSYTFNTTPEFGDGENTVQAIVDMEGDMQEENNYTDPITVSVLEPETVPYTPTLSANLVNKGWNVVDANNDGITMDIKNGAIVYTFNDTLAANDWMFTPCIEMLAGTYNVYYDYKANSSLNEKFEVFYGAGANVAAMTNEVANHDFNNTDYETVMQTITVAEDGIYNFGFHAISLAGNLGFNIANFKVYPVVDVIVTSGENGTVTPNGVVPVNYGENLNLAIVPNTMYHVAGVWVDDVQVMSEDPYNSNFMIYTLENVTEPHNVFVDYKLEYHIIKSVANYNPAYTDVPGEFIPASTDTLIDPDPVTVNFAAAPHYHLYSLEMAMMNEEDMVDVTADVVDKGDHTYSYLTGELVVANYYFKATFRRDTVAVNYLVNTGKGYADASDVLAQGAQYATWWDYSVANDVNAVANIRPYTTGDAHSDYHIVNVNINSQDMGVLDTYTFENIQQDQNIAIDFGYQVTTSIRNYDPTYLGSDEVRGTIAPESQLVAEGYPTVVTGTVQEHFHLYNLFVDGVDMIDAVEFDGQNYSFTIDSTIANYHIEAVVKIDTFPIHYHVLAGQGYADQSALLVAPAEYDTWVNYGDNFMMNLLPATGYSIDSVEVDGIYMYDANNYQFNNVVSDHDVYVSFKVNNYTVTTNAYGQGTVTDGISFTYDPANPVNYQFVAAADPCHHISAIFINGESVELSRVANPVIYLNDRLLNINNFDNFEMLTFGPRDIPEEVILTATNPLVNQTNVNLDTVRINFLNVAKNMVIDAHFEMNTYTMTSEITLGGMITPGASTGESLGASEFQGNGTIAPEGTQVVNCGSNMSYNIAANEGSYISAITVDTTTTTYTQDDNLTQTVVDFTDITADHYVGAVFTVKTFNLTASVEGGHGTIDGVSAYESVVAYGVNEILHFIPELNYEVSDVVVDGQSVGAVTSYEFVNITADHNVVVTFAPIQLTLTATSNIEACTITPATTTVQAGSNVDYTLTVATGYHLLNVIANGEEVNVVNNAFTITNVMEDYVIFANFAPNYVTVTVEQPEHATITPGTQTVAYGATPSYVIVPEVGYNVTNVYADNQIVAVAYNNGIGSFTLNPVTADITLTATTAIKTFTITATQSAHGTISPAPVQTVNYGGNVTYTITPDEYYEIVDVLVDGTSRGALSTYTFNNVTANHTIEAVFAAACYTPSNLLVVSVDTTSATLTWTGDAANYEVRYRAAGDADFTTEIVNINTITLNGLTPGTLYAWGVRALCTSELASDWAESAFTTNAIVIPPVGISTADLSSIKVYSNLNNVYIVNENGIAIENVTIYNIYGAQVYNGKANGNPTIISLDVANGNYIVKLATENGAGVYKLSIVR